MDYIPLDLHDHVNAIDHTETLAAPPTGPMVHLRGIPFIVNGSHGSVGIVRLAPGERATIATGHNQPCNTITFAHRAIDDCGLGLAPVGRVDAVYRFTFDDGQRISAEVRDGYEIAPLRGPADSANWGALPSLAVPDENDSVPARFHGAFSDTGFRQTEVVEAGRWFDHCGPTPGGWRFYLWAWTNPRPTHAISRIELEATGTVVDIGAISLGFVDEHPFRPDPARTVVTTLLPDEVRLGSQLTFQVDRGTAGYTTAIPASRLAHSGDGFAGWGDEPDSATVAVYARVAAVPSATIRLVTADGQIVTEGRWSQLHRESPRTHVGRLRVAELGRNWVRSRILDDATGEAMPCRVNFASIDGVPYQPHGHHHHVNSDLPSWHIDVGSDVRLGTTTYAYVNGFCEGWLPRGQVRVQVARGFDYQPVDELIEVHADTHELIVRAHRLFDPTADRWFSGDTHVHFVSSFGGLREAAAEGVSVVHLLQSQWGSLFTSTEEFRGHDVSSADGKTILFTSQENRQHFLGHLSLLGLKTPVVPWSTGGPPESEMGAGLEATLSDWADQCHQQEGTVVVPHFPAPNGEIATLIATGRVDALEWGQLHHDRAFSEYYRYLDAGFRLPIAGGTDKMTNEMPLGLTRTYVRLAEGETLSFTSWCEALKSGRSYMSSGPLLDFHVDGVGIGDTFTLPAGGGTVTVLASARCIFPIFRLELILSGRVVATSESDSGVHRLEIRQDVRVDEPGWMCIRVGGGGPSHLTRHRDEQRQAIMAHSSPIYVSCGRQTASDANAVRYTMTLVDRAKSYVSDLAPVDTGTDVLHHHRGDHNAYLLRPFEEARAALEQRLRIAQAR